MPARERLYSAQPIAIMDASRATHRFHYRPHPAREIQLDPLKTASPSSRAMPAERVFAGVTARAARKGAPRFRLRSPPTWRRSRRNRRRKLRFAVLHFDDFLFDRPRADELVDEDVPRLNDAMGTVRDCRWTAGFHHGSSG
jgi:hypothetical protein